MATVTYKYLKITGNGYVHISDDNWNDVRIPNISITMKPTDRNADNGPIIRFNRNNGKEKCFWYYAPSRMWKATYGYSFARENFNGKVDYNDINNLTLKDEKYYLNGTELSPTRTKRMPQEETSFFDVFVGGTPNKERTNTILIYEIGVDDYYTIDNNEVRFKRKYIPYEKDGVAGLLSESDGTFYPSTGNVKFCTETLEYIDFVDQEVKKVLMEHGIGDRYGITKQHAKTYYGDLTYMKVANDKKIRTGFFEGNKKVRRLDDLKYFTNIKVVGNSAFCGYLISLNENPTFGNITKIVLPPNTQKIEAFAFAWQNKATYLSPIGNKVKIEPFAFQATPIAGIEDQCG